MRPRRIDGLLTQRIDNELLVFNKGIAEGHALNETAAAVFDLCDGETGQAAMVAALSKRLGYTVDADIVTLAIAELTDAGLLVEDEEAAPMNRRAVIRKLGLSVAAAAALPLVETMIARPASAQGSGMTGPTGATGATGATGDTGPTGPV